MADLTFSQSERRNLFPPIALSIILLAIAWAVLAHFTPTRKPALSITRTSTWQAHTVYKTDTIVVGQDKAQDDLYVLATLHIDDHRMKLPLFLKDFTATLTTASGETLTTSAAEKNDLTPLYETFPALKPLSSPPLLREITIEPGQSAEGMVLLHFPITQDVWDHRQSAVLTVDFYHQASQSVTIPTVTIQSVAIQNAPIPPGKPTAP